jgi:tetratricopeptide (TPR) repeat protein
MRRADDAEALSRVLERLGEANPEERFYRLEALHAVLVMDFERALRLALEWNDGTFRDPSAPSTAIYLLTDITGDFDEAIRIGYAALPRFPANKSLLNNLAYALALASRYAEARRLISRVEDDVHVLATRGLIELLSGQTQAGHSFYDDAARLAEERSDSELVELVRYNEALFASLAHQRSGQGVEAEDLRVEFPHDWKDDASLVLLVALADREGIPYRVA